jgi:hypothetical protein
MHELHIQLYLRTLDNNRVFLRTSAYEGTKRVTGIATVELRTKDAYWFPHSLASAINAEMATRIEEILTQCMDPF